MLYQAVLTKSSLQVPTTMTPIWQSQLGIQGSWLLSPDSSLPTSPNLTPCFTYTLTSQAQLFLVCGSLQMPMPLPEISFLLSHPPSALLYSRLLTWLSRAKIVGNAEDFHILSFWTDHHTESSMVSPAAARYTFQIYQKRLPIEARGEAWLPARFQNPHLNICHSATDPDEKFENSFPQRNDVISRSLRVKSHG